MAHIVVEAAALTADISHTPDIVGKPAQSHRGCPCVWLSAQLLLTWLLFLAALVARDPCCLCPSALL